MSTPLLDWKRERGVRREAYVIYLPAGELNVWYDNLGIYFRASVFGRTLKNNFASADEAKVAAQNTALDVTKRSLAILENSE